MITARSACANMRALVSRICSRKASGSTTQLTSVTGEKLVGEVFFVNRFKVGDVIFNNLGVVFADAEIFRSLGLDDRPTALLGMNALRAFDKVAIDFDTARRLFTLIFALHWKG